MSLNQSFISDFSKDQKKYINTRESVPYLYPGLFFVKAKVLSAKRSHFFVLKGNRLPGSEMSRYPGRLLPWFVYDIKLFFLSL